MVMHARKIPRISDGFTEKHQPHNYDNSKYGSGKYRYSNNEKSRDSPSGNSLRSSSPDSRSQSPRYHKGNYYKIRDRDRDREREYRDYRDRDGSRSPKDRRRDVRDREREQRDNRSHDRVNSHKKEEKERLLRVGDWSEHLSSSGKKYYYNCRTEVSQWEKPSEWIEWERNHRSLVSVNKESSHPSHRHHEKPRPDKHSTSNEGFREMRDQKENERERHDRERREGYRTDDLFERRDNRKFTQDIGTADMDISSGGSTPTSEPHNSRIGADQISKDASGVDSSLILASRSKLSSTFGSLSTSVGCLLSSGVSTVTGSFTAGVSNHSTNTVSSSLLNDSGIHALQNCHSRGPPVRMFEQEQSSKSVSGTLCNTSYLDFEKAGIQPQLEPLVVTANTNNVSAGPPTPTHSENHDGQDIRKGSPNSSINSLQSLSQSTGSVLPALRPTVLSISPSLANYYKESLISHVQMWPAENIEKQCNRLNEEAHSVSSLTMTKVSAELKMTRSLVRLAEIQATLREQRILFFRQQREELEKMKSQNCFMSDT